MASTRGGSAGVGNGARLAALRDLEILDTPPEEDFDRFTRLASELLEAPVSLVSLVDHDRQFFKSQHGLPEPWASARQTPLSHSFCKHAVASGRALVIEDARRNPTVADNPAIRDLSAIAYAGVPLVLDDGHAVGTLCVVDAKPRRWAQRDLRILADLAAAVQALIGLRYTTARQRLHDQLTGIASGAVGNDHGGPDQVIARAAEVMRLAKGQRGRIMVADADHAVSSAARLRRRGALPGAVARGEIAVAFQPIVELATGTTYGFEALARWQHPEFGRVGPAEFIPVAEATGEIVLVGEHVLRTACRQLAAWRSESARDLQITVNLSAVQLAVPNFAEVVNSILLANRLPGPALVLEITEGVFVAPDPGARRNLDQIRRLGVRIALDDFGTGYSALSYLQRFPVDIIKADRSFLHGLGAGRRDMAVLRAILAIGDGMDIQVVAEGVETERQRELLRRSGCSLGQGFLFAPPLPPEKIVIGNRPQHPAAVRGLLRRAAATEFARRATTLVASPTD